MRVFLTGATGFVGSAVIQELISAGHQVLGLTRSDKGAEALKAAGAEPHHGTLEDLDSLRPGPRPRTARSTAASSTTSRTLRSPARSTAKPSRPSARRSPVPTAPFSSRPGWRVSRRAASPRKKTRRPDSIPRAPSEGLTLGLAARGVRAGVVRLSPSVHDEGDHGFVPMLIGVAREKGVSAYIGDGSNRWPGVHRLDAAHLYRLALEKGAAGTRYHGVADEGVPTRDIAEVIGRRLNLPVKSLSAEEAKGHFGWMALLLRHGPRRFQRPDPGAAGLAAHPSRPAGGPRPGTLLRGVRIFDFSAPARPAASRNPPGTSAPPVRG